MERNYTSLPATGLQSGAIFHQPARDQMRPVRLDDPATAVLTDFRQVRALTVYPNSTMDCAHERMNTHNVHLLLVVDGANRLVGLITSTDILGEKPVRLAQERGIRRAEILVSDVMTPRERLEVLDMDDVLHARVGHVVATLKAVGRQHAMVVDTDEEGLQTVRGLFSASQVSSQLDMPLETVEVARNFLEVEEMLAH